MRYRARRRLVGILRRAMHRLRSVGYALEGVRGLRGFHPRECACCGYQGLFRASGMPPRFDAQCPRCGALERHRLFVIACESLDLFSRRREVLHFAPEPALRAYIRSRAGRYVTADLTGVGVDRKENIEAISLADASFDVVVASHVLEHVDDHRAIRELKRVLRASGVLVCMVPIIEGWDTTYEDPEVLTAEARELHFGQNDHVRYYGRDFRDRLRAAGFGLTEYTADGRLSVRYGLLRGEKVFVATADGQDGVVGS